MVSPRRRVLGRRARMRLILFGIMSIIGLIALRLPYSTPTWLQLIPSAFAQSATATPTGDPQPNPMAALGEPPLTLQSSASAASAVAGEQISFTTTIAAASDEPRAIELRASIDGQLELLSVSGGSCSGKAALSCKLNVQRGRSATIVAAVRVRPSAAVGSRLFYQALAQDDQGNTAASDQVAVTVAPAPAVPTTPPDPAPRPTVVPDIPASGASASAHPRPAASRPARPAPNTSAPADSAHAAPNTPAPAALTLPVVPVAILRSSAGATTSAAPADGAAPIDSWLVTAPGAPAPPQALDPVVLAPAAPEPLVLEETPADAPAAAPLAVAPRQVVQLPNTAAAPPIAGLVAVLLSLALTIHGLRRVRRAAAQLDRQGAALGRLAKLAGAHARRRARMGNQSSEAQR